MRSCALVLAGTAVCFDLGASCGLRSFIAALPQLRVIERRFPKARRGGLRKCGKCLSIVGETHFGRLPYPRTFCKFLHGGAPLVNFFATNLPGYTTAASFHGG